MSKKNKKKDKKDKKDKKRKKKKKLKLLRCKGKFCNGKCIGKCKIDIKNN